jgi:phosphatidylglycerol:prolipoprotein diacylglycerol transferase
LIPTLFIIPTPSIYFIIIAMLIVCIAAAIWIYYRKKCGKSSASDIGNVISLLFTIMILLLAIHFLGTASYANGSANGVHVNAYGFMLMMGFILGITSAVKLGEKRGVPADIIIDLGMTILIGALIGARIQYILMPGNANVVLDFKTLVTAGVGGLGFFGGLAGGFLSATVFILIKKANFLRVLDTFAPGIALGYAITRIGCFLNGCCFGKDATGLWVATNFPHSPEGPVFHVHPTQIYASLMGLTMFAILWMLSRGNGLGRAGRLFAAFLAFEGVERFIMEIYRHADPNFQGILTPAQVFSIILIIVATLMWFYLPKKPAVD